jgi:hypothetical protein
MYWNPDNGETPLFRGRVSFATGNALKVSGMRWFRDEHGRDIGPELPGWPPAPVHVPRGNKKVKAGKGLFLAAGVTVAAVASAIGSPGPGGGGTPGSRYLGPNARPQDPAMEIEDFPVMGAPFGTVARTVPWQLDPDRRPQGYATELQLTDRRLLILGYFGPDRPADVLWQLPLNQVAGAQHHAYATHNGDVTIWFADGSWIRLDVEGPGRVLKVVWILSGNRQPVLFTEAQRAFIDKFAANTRGGTLDLSPVPVPSPDAPPGTLMFDLVIRRDNGLALQSGTLMLQADGAIYEAAKLRNK